MNPLDTTPRVWYPASEKKLMMSWRTHNEGTHVILSRTQHGLEKTLEFVSKKLRELPDVTGVFLIQTGRPSDQVMSHIRKRGEARLLDEFKSWVLGSVWSAVKHRHLPTPAFVKKCPCTDGCDTCNGYEFILRDLSWADAFERGAAVWVDQTKPKIQGSVYPDDAHVLHTEELHVARGDFGHHRQGIGLEKADLDYLPEAPLFFYQILEELPIPEWVLSAKAQFEEREKQAKIAQRASIEASRRRHLKEDKDKMSLMSSIFCK